MEVDFYGEIFEIEEFLQPSEARYGKEHGCYKNCSNIFDVKTFKVVGYTSTENGYMGVFKCNACGEIWRCHINTHDRYDEEKIKEMLCIILSNQKHEKLD
jgi:hypothetical protein